MFTLKDPGRGGDKKRATRIEILPKVMKTMHQTGHQSNHVDL